VIAVARFDFKDGLRLVWHGVSLAMTVPAVAAMRPSVILGEGAICATTIVFTKLSGRDVMATAILDTFGVESAHN